MPENKGKIRINTLKKQWSGYNLIALLCIALSMTILLSVFFNRALSLPMWYSVLFLGVFWGFLLIVSRSWKINDQDVSRLLNCTFPQLEESSGLLLKPENSLNFLERLQLRKIDQQLDGLKTPGELTRLLRASSIILAGVCLLSIIMLKLDYRMSPETAAKLHLPGSGKSEKPAITIPQIESVAITIIPPSYTGKSTHEQDRFPVLAEEGARVLWKVTTSGAVKDLHFTLNGSQLLRLQPLNEAKTEWSTTKMVTSPGFYQVSCDGRGSDLYKIEVIKDLPPAIRITSPQQYTYIEPGESHKINLRLSISDDYGVSSASLSATIASGKGEGVSFKEQNMSFATAFSNGLQYHPEKSIDLDQLNMQPGDELYFYVKAIDNHRQETRTDVYFISIQDTAALMSMEGITGGVSKVPEYFRSQRQIIIDTEKLLKDKPAISAEAFNSRSNNIGIDQKLLRLRYSKFLGAESEDEPDGTADDHETGSSDPADFNNESKLLDQYAHKHDDAEDATFLDPKQKVQMRDMLSEMWGAELRLRTFKTAEALPFEYRALRMLKDLQQQSRVYVAKTTYKTPPLKPEKRLTGELDKITDPLALRKLQQEKETQAGLKMASAILDGLTDGEQVTAAGFTFLREANLELNKRAAAQPSVYLPAVAAMRRIISSAGSGGVAAADVRVSQAALKKIIGSGSKIPMAEKAVPATTLADQYFRNLQPGNR